MYRDPRPLGLISVYFGNLPWYLPFFLKSCAFNYAVDFIIISDQSAPDDVPGNVNWVHMTFDELKNQFDQKIGFPVALHYPYKLCDLKPAYGIVFADLLNKYSFWGYCDIDIIFGKIDSFVTEEMFLNYDVISIREDYLAGYFTLYRNTSEINALFKKSKDWKRVFTESEHFCFDECAFLFAPLAAGKRILDLPGKIESMTHVVARLQSTQQIRAYFDHHALEGNIGNLVFKDGQLVYKGEFEVLLYHLIRFKDLPYLTCEEWKNIPSTFYINKNYLGRHPRKSIKGLLEKFKNEGSRIRKTIMAELDFNWKCLLSKFSPKHDKNIEHFTGNYKCEDWLMFIDTTRHGVSMHITTNGFLLPQSGLDELLHIIEMRPCKGVYLNKDAGMLLQLKQHSSRGVRAFELTKVHEWRKEFFRYDANPRKELIPANIEAVPTD